MMKISAMQLVELMPDFVSGLQDRSQRLVLALIKSQLFPASTTAITKLLAKEEPVAHGFKVKELTALAKSSSTQLVRDLHLRKLLRKHESDLRYL